MSFTFYTPAAHALLFQLAAGIVAHVAFRILKSVGEGKEKPTTLDYENDPNPGVREQENKAFSIALCTTSAFALSCYLKRDPYATAVPTIQALMAIAPLMNRNPIDKFGVAIGAVVLAVGTALAAVTAPFYNALSPVPSSEFGNAAIMPVMQWAVGSPYSSALLGALAFSVGRTLLCSKDMRHGCDAFRTIEIGALTGFLAYQTYVQSDVTLLAANNIAVFIEISIRTHRS